MMLYVHVPFCAQRCQFCEYTVVDPRHGTRDDVQARYFDALMGEFEMYKARACVDDESGAAIDLYQSCETPLKKKLMSSNRIKNNPARAGCKVLLEEMEKITTMGLNVDIERHEFRKMLQEDGESIGDFESRLSTKARYCDFAWCGCCTGGCERSRSEEEIRTQIVSGMGDEDLQRTFLEKAEEFNSLQKVVAAIRAKETANAHQEALGGTASRAAVNRKQQAPKQNGRKPGAFGNHRKTMLPHHTS